MKAYEIIKKHQLQNKINSIYHFIELKEKKLKQLESQSIQQDKRVKRALIDYYQNEV